MANHDEGYKLLFSHASLVADVLRGFIKEDWVKEVDFESLERVEGSYVSEKLRRRESDMLWKVKWRGRSLYVYILLEFQTRVDRFMAVRLMGYLALLYQDLIRQKALTRSGKLPPVFLLVLYNGKRRWLSALDVADLIESVPGGLETYRPHLRYALLDETQIPEMELESERNLAAALFQLEKSRDPDTFRRAIARMVGETQLDESLRRSVRIWVTEVLIPARFPELPLAEARSLEEVHTMLADNVKQWTREWKREGMQKGMQKGLKKGRQEGLAEGVQAFQEFLLSGMAERFGPLPKEVRRSVKKVEDLDELKKLAKQLLAASSLDDLDLS
jgi:predicted transposase YdaD